VESGRFPETASVRLPINRKEKCEEEPERALPETTGTVEPPLQSPARNFRHHQSRPEIKCRPEEFEKLRRFLHVFVTTGFNGNPLVTPPDWVEGPPDETITAQIAERGGWRIAEIVHQLRRLKEQGRKPDRSYAWFVTMIAIRIRRRVNSEVAASRHPDTLTIESQSVPDYRGYIESKATALRQRGPEFLPIADDIDQLAVQSAHSDPSSLDDELRILEQRMFETARGLWHAQRAQTVRRELELYLRPHRCRMTTAQIAALETQFLDRATLELEALPRLSIYYMPGRSNRGDSKAAA